MFTGIVSEVGRVKSIRRSGGSVHLAVAAPRSASALAVGDSVAVDGVCQTVVALEGGAFSVEAVEETLLKTTLGDLARGEGVNIELALKVGDRLGGHFVQGHVDGVGVVAELQRRTSSWFVGITFDREWSRYVIPVGSIAVNGVSLTVARCGEGRAWVSLIPHTLETTTFSDLEEGRRVNLEFDVLGKYVANQLRGGGGIDEEKLRDWGYLH